MAQVVHTVSPPLPAEPLAPRKLPPLQNGDCLTRDEFERRYNAMPKLNKAELVEGEVHMPSPVSFRKHSSPHLALNTWLGVYRAGTPGVLAGDNSTVRLDLDNELQPDALLLVTPECGGQARVSTEDFVEGAPELVAEVAATSASYDLHGKMNAYRRSGVKEYVVWRVLDEAVDWFVLRGGQYERLSLEKTAAGVEVYKSQISPGLWLDPAALLRDDLAAVLNVLREGLASSEHAAFAARLQEVAKGRA